MKEEIEQLIQSIKAGKVAETEIQRATERLRSFIKNDASQGREFGELLSRIKQASKATSLQAEVNWLQVGNGFLAIGHKPGGKISFEGLKNAGTSVVLTLLNENEGAAQIGRQLQQVNINWIWFPFSASKPHEGSSISEVYDLFANLSSLIHAGNKIYVHCSAGIHRTGMITYGFLRSLGTDKAEAFNMLRSLRAVTAAQVGEDRLLWADQFGTHNRGVV